MNIGELKSIMNSSTSTDQQKATASAMLAELEPPVSAVPESTTNDWEIDYAGVAKHVAEITPAPLVTPPVNIHEHCVSRYEHDRTVSGLKQQITSLTNSVNGLSQKITDMAATHDKECERLKDVAEEYLRSKILTLESLPSNSMTISQMVALEAQLDDIRKRCNRPPLHPVDPKVVALEQQRQDAARRSKDEFARECAAARRESVAYTFYGRVNG